MHAKTILKGLLAVVATNVLLLTHTAQAAPTVINAWTAIDTDTVWSLEGSPYLVKGWIDVSNNATLSIDPGVVVKFGDNGVGVTGRISLTNGGSLIAHGTNLSPIQFTDFRDDSVGGDTNNDGSATLPPTDLSDSNNMKFDALYRESSGGTMSIKYAHIKYIQLGVIYQNGNAQQPLDLENTSIEKSRDGVWIFGKDTIANISKVEFRDCKLGLSGDIESTITVSDSIFNGNDIGYGSYNNHNAPFRVSPNIVTKSIFENNGAALNANLIYVGLTRLPEYMRE